MNKARYSAQDEQRLMAQLWSPEIADDPEAYVRFVYPWGQAGTPLAHHKGPRRWQLRELRRLRAFIVENKGRSTIGLQYEALRRAIAAGRGIGKSAYVSWIVDWFNTTRIGSTVYVSANTESQLRTVTWGELAKWTAMSIHSHWWDMSATRRVPQSWLASLVERDLKIGTRQWGAEGKLWSEENPDGYAGPHNDLGMLVVFDEASGIPDSIWSVAGGFFTEPTPNRLWLAFSNGRRNSGYFFEAVKGAKRDFWEAEQIDARSVEGTDKAIYQQIIDEYGEDSDQARVEVYGEFPSEGDDQFIQPFLVEEAIRRKGEPDPSAPIIIGVDPARGGDKTVIAVRQGRRLLALRAHDESDTMLVVGLVIDAIQEFSPVLTVIDEGGVGAGVYDRLKEQRYKVRGVNYGNKAKRPAAHGNMRAQIWSEMKDWLKTASLDGLEPRIAKRLKNDLCGVRKKPDSAGVMFLESKKDMRGRGMASPDYADAIANTFAFPVAGRESRDKVIKRAYSPGIVTTSWMGS